jgi:hypothetical protein
MTSLINSDPTIVAQSIPVIKGDGNNPFVSMFFPSHGLPTKNILSVIRSKEAREGDRDNHLR